MRNKKTKSLGISLAIIGGWIGLVFLLFANDHSALGKMYGVFVMYYITRYAAIGLAIIMLLFRISRVIKNNSNFFYIFAALLNVLVALLCVVLYYIGEATMEMVHEFLQNMIVGAVLVVDIFFYDYLTAKAE